MQNKLPMHLSRRCGARTRRGSHCRSPAMPNGRCRMHGGLSPGAPKGNKNAFKHGRYAAEAIEGPTRDCEALARGQGFGQRSQLGACVPVCCASRFTRRDREEDCCETAHLWQAGYRIAQEAIERLPIRVAASTEEQKPSVLSCDLTGFMRSASARSETFAPQRPMRRTYA